MNIVFDFESGKRKIAGIKALLRKELLSRRHSNPEQDYQVSVEVTCREESDSSEELGIESRVLDLETGKPRQTQIVTSIDYYVQLYLRPYGDDEKPTAGRTPVIPELLLIANMSTQFPGQDQFKKEVYCQIGLILESLMAHRTRKFYKTLTITIQDDASYQRTEATPEIILQLKKDSKQKQPEAAHVYVMAA